MVLPFTKVANSPAVTGDEVPTPPPLPPTDTQVTVPEAESICIAFPPDEQSPPAYTVSLPVESVRTREDVTFESTVEELNVAVALKLAAALKVCAAVHVTEDAAVTNPGVLDQLIAPVEVLKEIGAEPENSE